MSRQRNQIHPPPTPTFPGLVWSEDAARLSAPVGEGAGHRTGPWPPPPWAEVEFRIHSLDMARCSNSAHRRFGDVVGLIYGSHANADVESLGGDLIFMYRAYGPPELIAELLSARRRIIMEARLAEAFARG